MTRSRGMNHISVIFNFNFFFQYDPIVQCPIEMGLPSQSDIGCRDMINSLKCKNNTILKHLSPISSCNSKSMFPTSDSFPLIMSHIHPPPHTHTHRRNVLSQNLCFSSQWNENGLIFG